MLASNGRFFGCENDFSQGEMQTAIRVVGLTLMVKFASFPDLRQFNEASLLGDIPSCLKALPCSRLRARLNDHSRKVWATGQESAEELAVATVPQIRVIISNFDVSN